MSPLELLSFLALLFASAACGVKGPPLPPIPATPQQSDRLELRTTPHPSPRPT